MYRFILGVLIISLLGLIWGCQQQPTAPDQAASASVNVTSLAKGGFDQYGYNKTARIFNGTGESWALGKGLPADYLGIYSKDKLVMKWNAEWDRGNAEGWTDEYYAAWEDNEWNGVGVKGGSGEVWHYKIIWVGKGLEASPYWRDGGEPVWDQFEIIMDQGMAKDGGPIHTWVAKSTPNGYGS